MKLEGAAVDLVGSDIEYPEFDPWGFTKTADADRLAWYRAAELKHGRVAMLASLGQIYAYFFRGAIPDPVFNQVPTIKPWVAWFSSS
jgi:Chlorophyll A-B binding protein